MAETIRVSLQFAADTKQAKRDIENLQSTIDRAISFSMSPNKNFGLGKEMEAARTSALQLKQALASAMNVDTGKLNLNKFNKTLRASGQSISSLYTNLSRLGVDGKQAFMNMANVIASADTKVISLSEGAKKLINTFANTARYQAATFAIQTITGSIQQAINYTAELDKSLNDIRIVTGQSSEQMAKFAKEANRAAKLLTTTTNEYAKASLIYFQQGLSDAEVKERTATTIKLANAVGRSSEEVSNWMTAIWNNFDDGSESLEYYADVIAKLGAATASSADEIAGGLEKFSAVTETIGLSYEYAASMLATITAQTRQSEDVVGTALKTILSRMEGLKLGDTLDDGTTMNQYSQALANVGVNIKTTSGELKDMDQILDETASRWKLLSKDQQIALAQSVAGVRQYNTFVSMMDTWDITKQNVELAKSSAGALDIMNEIYADSVEGAKKEMTAAAEELYSKLLNPETMEAFYKFTEKILNVITRLTESFGGMRGILLMAAAALSKLYQPKLVSFLSNVGTGLVNTWTSTKNLFTKGQFVSDEALKAKSDAAYYAAQIEFGSEGGQTSSQVSKQILQYKQQMVELGDKLTPQQKEQLEWQIKLLEATRDNIREEEKRLEILQEENMARADSLEQNIGRVSDINRQDLLAAVAADTEDGFGANLEGANIQERQAFGDYWQQVLQTFEQLGVSTTRAQEALQHYVRQGRGAAEELRSAFTELGNSLPDFTNLQGSLDTDYLQVRGAAAGRARATATTFEKSLNLEEVLRGAEKTAVGSWFTKGSSGAMLQQQINELGITTEDGKAYDVQAAITNAIQEKIDAGQQFDVDLPEIVKSVLTEVRQKITDVISQAATDTAKGVQNADMVRANKARVAKSEGKMGQYYSIMLNGGQTASGKTGQQLDQEMRALEKKRSELEHIKSGATGVAAGSKKYAEVIKELTDVEEKIKTLQAEAEQLDTQLAETLQQNQESPLNSALEGTEQQLKEVGEEAARTAEKMEDVKQAGKAAGEGPKKAFDDTTKSMNNWANTTAHAVSSLTSTISSANMAASAIVSLNQAYKDGTVSAQHWMSTIAAVSAAIIPAISRTVMAFVNASNLKIQANNKEAASETNKAIAASAANAATGRWIELGATIALLALTGINIAIGFSQNNKEQKKQRQTDEAHQAKETLELIKVTDELSDSIGELSDKYKELQAAGKGAYEILEDMKKQAPELIEKYKKLVGTVENLKWEDIAQLEQYYEQGLLTGDWSGFFTKQEDIQNKVQAIGWNQAVTAATDPESGIKAQTKKIADKVNSGQTTFGFTIDGVTQQVTAAEGWQNIWLNALNSAPGQNNLDLSSAGAVGEKITQLEEWKEQNPNADEKTRQQVEQFLQFLYGLQGTYQAASSSSEEQNNLGQAALAQWDQKVDQNGSSNPINETKYATDYNTKGRQDLINDLMAYWSDTVEGIGITDEQAVAIIKMSPTYGPLEKIYQLITPNGIIGSQVSQGGRGGDVKVTEAISNWLSGLSAEDLTYASMMNWEGLTKSGQLTSDDFDAELARIKQDKAKDVYAQDTAIKLDISTEEFNLLYNILAKTNPELAKDKELLSQITYESLKLKKAVSTLGDKWDETWELITSNDLAQQAEGLAKLQKIISEIYGINVTDDNALRQLAQFINEFLTGDFTNWDQYAEILAQAQIFEIRPTLDESEVDGLTNALFGIIDGLSAHANVEVGTELTGTDVLGTEMAEALAIIAKASGEAKAKIDEVLMMRGWKLTIDSEGQTHLTRISDKNLFSSTFKNYSSKKSGGSSKDKKYLEEEAERYHEIEKAIETAEQKMNRYADAKERAFGQKHLDYLAKEIAENERLVELNEEKLRQAKEYFNADREALSRYGVSFDADGNITNYDEVYAAQINQYNKNPEGYEESYNKFTEQMKQYEETLELIRDLEDTIVEKNNEIIDAHLEEIEYTIELNFKINDYNLDTIEYFMDNLEDSAEDIAKKFYLMGDSMAAYTSKANASLQAIQDVLGVSDIDLENILANPGRIEELVEEKNLTEEQIDNLYDYVDNLKEATNSMKELREEVSDNLVAAFENTNKEMEKSIDNLSHLTSMIESYRNILDLAGRDALGISDELMIKLAESQYNIANNNIEIAKAQLDQNTRALEKLKSDLAAATSEEERKELQEAIEEIEPIVQENQQALLEATASGLEAATALFEEETNSIIRTFEDSMSGIYGNYEQFSAAFERQKELSERYLKDYQQIYELSKLNRDIMKSIDENDSIAAKQKLRDIQEEINELQATGAEMTQYEVDALRARYELRLAEIALEEAQKAKSQVRMQRDSEGNWGYVYTADQNNIDAAQQAYEDKLYAYQNLTQQRTNELIDQMAQIPQQFSDAVRAIYEDQTLNDQERAIAIAEVEEYYQDMYAHVIEQMNIVNADAARLYEQDWKAYSDATGYKMGYSGDWIDSFDETIMAEIGGYESIEEAQSEFLSASKDMLTNLSTAYSTYRTKVNNTLELGIGDIKKFVGAENIPGSLAYYLSMAEQGAKEAANEAKRLGDENAKAFEKATNAATEWLKKYSVQIDGWITKTGEVATAVGNITGAYANLSAQINTTIEDYKKLSSAQSGLTVGGGSGAGPTAPTEPNTVQTETNPYFLNHFTMNVFDTPSISAGNSQEKTIGGSQILAVASTMRPKYEENKDAKIYEIIIRGKAYWINNKTAEELMKASQKSAYAAFDTGGYTGSWDSSGRLAMLHQKEIVLNAHDTENFLAGINVLREITQAIDLQAMSQANRLSALASASVGTTAQVLEQQVTIHAEFPNATSRSEIEEAFDTLLNRASQFANRKNK